MRESLNAETLTERGSHENKHREHSHLKLRYHLISEQKTPSQPSKRNIYQPLSWIFQSPGPCMRSSVSVASTQFRWLVTEAMVEVVNNYLGCIKVQVPLSSTDPKYSSTDRLSGVSRVSVHFFQSVYFSYVSLITRLLFLKINGHQLSLRCVLAPKFEAQWLIAFPDHFVLVCQDKSRAVMMVQAHNPSTTRVRGRRTVTK